MKHSVRNRLLIALTSTMAVLYFVRLGFGYLQSERSTRFVYDEMLINTADSIATRIAPSPHGYQIQLPSECLSIYTHNGVDSFFYEVFDSSGRRLLGNAHLVESAQQLGELLSSQARDIKWQGKNLRIVALEIPVTDTPLQRVKVVMAETLIARKKFFTNSFASIAVAQFLTMAASIALVWLFTNRAFVPFARLKDKIKRRKKGDFSKIKDSDVPEELEPVVSEFNKMCAELEANIETRERFISDAAHQLRTPLAGLKTYSSFACELEKTEELKDVVQRIDHALNVMSRLVNQLLMLAQLEGSVKSATFDLQPTDLNQAVSSVVSMAKMQAASKNIKLRINAEREPVTVLANPISLEQLLSNLIENAIQYSPSDSEVFVSIRRGDGIELTVEDHGPGISAAERPHVFERFYRIRGAGGSGSGLGLSIVKEAALVHRAEVTIDTPPGGIGTMFTVAFPLPDREFALQGCCQVSN